MMRTIPGERVRAKEIAEAVDRLIAEPGMDLSPLGAEDAGVLAVARELAGLPSLLGPVSPELEQRVMSRIRSAGGSAWRAPHFRLRWAATGLVLALALALILWATPFGQTAVASFMAVFHLGRTEVRITPAKPLTVQEATAVVDRSTIERYVSLEEAQAQVPFALLQPAYLPSNYRLREVKSYTYPDLPTWIPQPLLAELVYEDDIGKQMLLQIYPILLGEQASISGLNLQATPIQNVQDVVIGGQPGVLLQLGQERDRSGWQQVVWEYGDLILALTAAGLDTAELLRVGDSVR